MAQPFALLHAVARGQTVAGFVKELAGQWRSRSFAFGAPALCRRGLEDLLYFHPMLRINDSWVLTVEDLILVADASGIDRVGQDVMDMTAVKGIAAGHPPCPTRAMARSKADLVCLLFHLADGAML